MMMSVMGVVGRSCVVVGEMMLCRMGLEGGWQEPQTKRVQHPGGQTSLCVGSREKEKGGG